MLQLHFWFDRGQDPLFKDWQQHHQQQHNKANVVDSAGGNSRISNVSDFLNDSQTHENDGQQNSNKENEDNCDASKTSDINDTTSSKPNTTFKEENTRSVLTAKCAMLNRYPGHHGNTMFNQDKVCIVSILKYFFYTIKVDKMIFQNVF